VGSDRSRRLISLGPLPATRGALQRAAIAAGVGGLVLTGLLSPMRLCLTAALLHLPCPGCGLTRAGLALLHGDVARATAFHPLAIVLVPLTAVLLATETARYVRTGNAPRSTRLPRWADALAAALVAMLIVVWVARFFGYFGGPVSV
jgi:hypothetical protein